MAPVCQELVDETQAACMSITLTWSFEEEASPQLFRRSGRGRCL